jgi:hypothetical protein
MATACRVSGVASSDRLAAPPMSQSLRALGRFTLALEIHAGGFAELRIQSAARWYVAHRRHSRGAEARVVASVR